LAALKVFEEFQDIRLQLRIRHFKVLRKIGDDFGDRAAIATLKNGAARLIQLENAFWEKQHRLPGDPISLDARVSRQLRTVLKRQWIHDGQAA
jgi:hypothetical protein